MNTANRVINRLLSALVGLVLLIVALVAAVEIMVALFGGNHFLVPTDRWSSSLRHTPWQTDTVRLVATGAVVIGLVLVIAGAMARARIITMKKPKDTVEVIAPARAVAQILRRQTESVAGVAAASSEVSARGARVSATVPLADTDRVEAEIGEVLAETLSKIPWANVPSLQIEISAGRDKPARSVAPDRGPGSGVRR